MLTDNPFLYRVLRPGKGRWRQLALALAGPLILVLPSQLAVMFSHRFDSEASQRLSLFAYVAYLCIRAIGGSVGKISQERERGSWEVLLSAGMSQGRVGRGLWLACLLPVWLEICLTLPWLMLNMDHWPALFVLFLGLGLFYSGLGLFCSLRFSTSLKAAQISYGWLALCGGGSFLFWLFGQIGTHWRDLVLVGNPWALVSALADHPPRALDNLGLLFHWGLGLALGLRLEREIFRTLDGSRGEGAQSGRRRPQHENPLLYRNQFGQRGYAWLWGAALYAAVVLGPWLVGCAQTESERESRVVFSLLGHLFFWLLVAVQRSSNVLCREREQRTLEALLTTRLSAREVLNGIWSQTVAPASRQALLLAPLLLVPMTMGYATPRLAQWLLLMLLTQSFILAWGTAALAFSLGSRTTLRAFQSVYLTLAFLTIGTLVLDVSLIDPLLDFNRPVLSLVNPLLSVLFLGLDPGSEPGILKYCWVFALVFHLAVWRLGRRYLLRRLS